MREMKRTGRASSDQPLERWLNERLSLRLQVNLRAAELRGIRFAARGDTDVFAAVSEAFAAGV
jgi:hypothetical protein